MTEVATEADGRIRQADIDQAERVCGLLFPSKTSELHTTATYDSIRNFARGYGDDNPLYTDEDYGPNTRWGSQIAPPLIGVAVNKPMRGDPRPPEAKIPSFRGVHNFVSGTAWEFYRPVFPGDTLYTLQGYENVEVKDSEFAGKTVIITRRHVRMNQRAEVVSVARVTLIHAERKAARSRKKYGGIEPATYTDDDIAALDAIYAQERPRGEDPRWWEDVAIGDELGPLAKGPLTVTDLIVFHAGGYGFSPFVPATGRIAYRNRQRIPAFYVKNPAGIPDVSQRVHWDSDWAQQVGAPMPYDYGVLRDCWLSHVLTDWMGDDAWAVRQSSQLRKFNYLGDSHVISGVVTGKRIEDGMAVVDVELRGISQRGDNTCPATATVSLPSREHGPAKLPPSPRALDEEASRFMDRHRELLAESRNA